ncbi:phytanoyl-CoA dioxygenase domain-containing protein 1 homolog isoform X2 [Macrosteles quadrilineatus]|nr:phytanoyl-CoA dioxygenase domain-containing protein 1 homolog isoform X2 [Macrosteles quadrilineatus]XP_054273262.1 phytanoyl-CoA dioxygenase domain-containing protein 1 homolog isoform X2 [Macrosteles quadrilineatus]
MQDGFLVLEDLFTENEVNELKSAGDKLTQEIPTDCRKCVFSTTQTQQSKDKYFLESADKISYFYEAGALNEGGELQVDPSVSLNKVGHALHWLHPTFRKVTFCERVKEVCYQLGMEDPVVVQSMYIYKNPGIGSEVVPHQDSTFVHTEPNTTVGFWIALEDATLENGCLWFVRGSHCSGVHRRFIRNPDNTSADLLIYDKPPQIYPNSAFRSEPVKKGTCIVIHGQVVHKSEHNKSQKSRHAYTFHVIDAKNSKYSQENWLQTEEGFKSVYQNY